MKTVRVVQLFPFEMAVNSAPIAHYDLDVFSTPGVTSTVKNFYGPANVGSTRGKVVTPSKFLELPKTKIGLIV